jgi:uridine kinase
MREGALSAATFMDNGFPAERMNQNLTWGKQHQVHTVAEVNEAVRSGRMKPVADEALALYEQSLDQAATKVMDRLNRGDKLRMLWVSGPSSSGKTTTTVKLTQRLEKHGLRFLMLNLDDYFWSLVEHPTDWINDRNYETPEALDIQLLNQPPRPTARGPNRRETALQFQGRSPRGNQTRQT